MFENRSGAAVPPGWPPLVPPPESPGWQVSAASWLLDFCPADYRAYAGWRRNPVALASAICKAAADAPAPTAALATLAGTDVARRLRLLLDRPAARPSALADGAARALAASLVALVLVAGATMPTLARAGVDSIATSGAHSCH